MPVIIERLLYNLSLASQYIIDKFKNKKMYNNTYGVIIDLPNIKKLEYLFIIAFIIFLMYNVNINLNHIFGLFVIIIIISLLIQKDDYEFNNYLNDKDIELKFLNTILFENRKDYTIGIKNTDFYLFDTNISYLYTNPLLVTLLYKLRTYIQYNNINYKDVLFHVNNLLKVKSNIYQNSKNKLQLFEIAFTEYTKTLNAFQSMIYSLPSTKATNKEFKNAMDILDKILLHDIYDIKNKIMNFNNGDTTIDTIPENFFENFIIKPEPNIKSFANKIYNFYI
tara:strand:- start:171 stop:1010 length:840 start_codon:yes stop_codon:yes gene_type:complete